MQIYIILGGIILILSGAIAGFIVWVRYLLKSGFEKDKQIRVLNNHIERLTKSSQVINDNQVKTNNEIKEVKKVDNLEEAGKRANNIFN